MLSLAMAGIAAMPATAYAGDAAVTSVARHSKNMPRGAAQFTPNANPFKAYKSAENPKFTLLGMSIDLYGLEEHLGGLYHISSDGSMSYIEDTELVSAMSGAWIVNGVYYTYDSYNSYAGMEINLMSYDAVTGEEVAPIFVDAPSDYYAMTVAYEPSEEVLYGCFWIEDTDEWTFERMYLDDLSKEVICKLGDFIWMNLFFDDKGNLYGIDEAGALYSVSTTDGSRTKIGDTGYSSMYQTGAVYDSVNKVAYWAVSNDDEGFLASIDLTTGAATKLFDFYYHDEVCGLCMEGTSNSVDIVENEASVFVEDRAIVVENADAPVNIYSVDGSVVASSQPGGETRFPVSDGVYVVKVGDSTSKVIVK